MTSALETAMDAVLDSGWLPPYLIKLCTRQMLRSRVATDNKRTLAQITEAKMSWIEQARTRPMAVSTDAANEQQYEVSTGVFANCLGPRMKYSCSLWEEGAKNLEEAELAMLELYIPRAQLEDGMSILDLGCGWGSAVLLFAERFPKSKITGFSNSQTQKEYVDEQARRKGLTNLEIITGDVVDYEFAPEQYDRIISVELFEHMKNYELLMAKMAHALKPGGKLFVHHFCHRDTVLDFDSGWMSRYFFTGGTMPCADILVYFQKDLTLERRWWISGLNYSRTLQAWLENWLANKKQAWPHLVETYGEDKAAVWYHRWMAYHASLTEFFSTEGGEIWGVSHSLFVKPGEKATGTDAGVL